MSVQADPAAAVLHPTQLGIYLDGVAVANVDDWLVQLEVDERCDGASVARIVVDLAPIASPDGGDWDMLASEESANSLGLPHFRVLRRISIDLVRRRPAGGEFGESPPARIFDGYITSLEPSFGEARVPDSRLVLTAMDAMILMHLETVTTSWTGLSDSAIASALFAKYGFATTDESIEPTAFLRDGDHAGLTQRGTDAEFLRHLARRNGFELYVEASDDPVEAGAHPGNGVVGHFHRPRPDSESQLDLRLFPADEPTLIEFRAKWDCHQPTTVRGWHINEQSRKLERVEITESPWPKMDVSSRADLLAERLGTIQPVRQRAQPDEVSPISSAEGEQPGIGAVDLQTEFVPHNYAELELLAQADFQQADWFVNGSGTVAGDRYPSIIRPRRPVGITGAGHLLSGTWYVQAVRHRWAVDPDDPEVEVLTLRYEADITAARNALGGLG